MHDEDDADDESLLSVIQNAIDAEDDEDMGGGGHARLLHLIRGAIRTSSVQDDAQGAILKYLHEPNLQLRFCLV